LEGGMKNHSMRSAHASLVGGRFVAIYARREIKSTATGAQVTQTFTERKSPKMRATKESTLALLERMRAA
jgi:hypothetical protein